MHSPAGDLLVVYSNSRLCYRDSALDRQTSAMLGFEAPTFTCGTDLMLPVGANADLREVSASDTKTKVDGTDDVAATALAKLVEINNVSEFLRCVQYDSLRRDRLEAGVLFSGETTMLAETGVCLCCVGIANNLAHDRVLSVSDLHPPPFLYIVSDVGSGRILEENSKRLVRRSAGLGIGALVQGSLHLGDPARQNALFLLFRVRRSPQR